VHPDHQTGVLLDVAVLEDTIYFVKGHLLASFLILWVAHFFGLLLLLRVCGGIAHFLSHLLWGGFLRHLLSLASAVDLELSLLDLDRDALCLELLLELSEWLVTAGTELVDLLLLGADLAMLNQSRYAESAAIC
jgi:hypothetical protein